MKKNDIIHFIDAHVFDGEFQGTRTYILEIYTRLLKNNPKITIFFGANNINKLQKVFGRFKNAKYIQYTSHGRVTRIFKEIPRIIDEINCSFAHFQYILPFKKNPNCKYIVTIHDILFNDFSEDFSLLYRLQRNFLFYISAKRADLLLTVSQYSKERISEKYNIHKDDIVVSPNGVGEDYFTFPFSTIQSRELILSRYKIENFILYVSRIEPRKNQSELLRFFITKKLWLQNYKLVFIGKNSLKSDFILMLKQLNEEERKSIYWLEQVPFIDLKHFYNAAKVFVYPSKAEGFGIPPLEAAALGTPVVCSNATAMHDFNFFEPNMFNPSNFDELTKKTLSLLNTCDNRCTDIREKIKDTYSWDVSSKILEKYLYTK